MDKPRGIDLMRTLIELLAEQEGAQIKCVIEQREERLECTAGRSAN